MAVWPSTLPEFSLHSTGGRQDGALRTPMSTGPSKSRRRFSAVSRYISTQVVLDATQKAVFDTFFADTLAEGALSFDKTDPSTGTLVSMKFTAPPTEAWKRSDSDARVTLFVVGMELEVLP